MFLTLSYLQNLDILCIFHRYDSVKNKEYPVLKMVSFKDLTVKTTEQTLSSKGLPCPLH